MHVVAGVRSHRVLPETWQGLHYAPTHASSSLKRRLLPSGQHAHRLHPVWSCGTGAVLFVQSGNCARRRRKPSKLRLFAVRLEDGGSMFDAVLPSGKEDGRAVYIVAIRPNTIGFHDSPFPVQERHEGYAYDLSRCREALESVDDRGSSWGAIAVELCRFRAEWHMSATRGRDVLRKAEHIDDDSFESKFAEHLADWSSSLPSLARTGAPQPLTGDGAWPRYAPDDDEWESEDLGGLGWGDEELAGYDW